MLLSGDMHIITGTVFLVVVVVGRRVRYRHRCVTPDATTTTAVDHLLNVLSKSEYDTETLARYWCEIVAVFFVVLLLGVLACLVP